MPAWLWCIIKRVVIGYYSNTLLHVNLCGEKELNRTYEEVVMSVWVKVFQT